MRITADLKADFYVVGDLICPGGRAERCFARRLLTDQLRSSENPYFRQWRTSQGNTWFMGLRKLTTKEHLFPGEALEVKVAG